MTVSTTTSRAPLSHPRWPLTSRPRVTLSPSHRTSLQSTPRPVRSRMHTAARSYLTPYVHFSRRVHPLSMSASSVTHCPETELPSSLGLPLVAALLLLLNGMLLRFAVIVPLQVARSSDASL